MSIDKSQFHARQSTLIHPNDLRVPITILGAGGIGSWATLALSKLGCSQISTVDFDRVSEENIGSQLYGEQDIDTPKVMALQKYIQGLTSQKLNILAETWTPNSKNTFSEISISAVDSIGLRRQIWEVVKQRVDIMWYLDARMAGELIRLYTVNMLQNSNWYEKTFPQNDNQIEPIPCTERSVVYNTFACASLIAKQIKAIAKKEYVPQEIVFDLSTLNLMCNDFTTEGKQ